MDDGRRWATTLCHSGKAVKRLNSKLNKHVDIARRLVDLIFNNNNNKQLAPPGPCLYPLSTTGLSCAAAWPRRHNLQALYSLVTGHPPNLRESFDYRYYVYNRTLSTSSLITC
ncbi:hypothetical protein K402DRAFT_393150 [Aulographum hederae CBS 113979]|uniref:Uncharacterized protein n=1 Tax=Aulographum hederae CBS 113979 TaxID=1176131 RepID=A0A6G1H1F4_9PEZI|nr:hypothetical protein K402DRAFT_393150 [Aulographum hederae CBS 113979]